MIEFKNVVKTYGSGEGRQIAVNDVSFTIDDGEFAVILGQSGAGKSTVLNMLGGMDVPTSGSVTVAGQEISGSDVGRGATAGLYCTGAGQKAPNPPGG